MDVHSYLADVLILAAGDFPSHPEALKQLEKYRDRILCCDSAAETLLHQGYQPMMVIGDGDSISETTRRQLGNHYLKIEEQDDNDLTKSVHYAIAQGYRRLIILGATGKREDHTLGNISLLADYIDEVEVVMQTDYGYFVPIRQNTRFSCQKGQQISFFCMDAIPITLEGLKWPLKNQVLTRWWQATLNEAVSDHFEVKTQGHVIVFLSNTSNI